MTTHEFPDADSAGVVRLDEGHHPGDGKMPAEFENPGLPPHVHRMADHDEAGAKRAERQVAGLFGLSMLGTIVAMVGYFAFSTEHRSWVPGLGHVSTTNLLLGIGQLALAVLHQFHSTAIGRNRRLKLELAVFHAVDNGFELGERRLEFHVCDGGVIHGNRFRGNTRKYSIRGAKVKLRKAARVWPRA